MDYLRSPGAGYYVLTQTIIFTISLPVSLHIVSAVHNSHVVGLGYCTTFTAQSLDHKSVTDQHLMQI
jgi:hypothetical protein